MADERKVQELTLYALDVFIKFCEKHHLRYYFTGGALIGVLRHKGFIPWDDDIDIGMPRVDFDLFHKLIKEEMPEGFGICNRHTDSDWHFAMSQFLDLQSEIEINLAEKPRKAHIWIDIFPLDGLPDNRFSRWIRVKYILLHRYLVQMVFISTQVDSHRERPFIEKIVLNICKGVPIGKFINTSKVLDHLERVLRKYDFDDSNWCGNMLGRYREKEVVLTKWFGTACKGEFEGKKVNIPEDSHAILSSLYGDYMQLPSEKNRVSHRVKVIKCRNIWEKN